LWLVAVESGHLITGWQFQTVQQISVQYLACDRGGYRTAAAAMFGHNRDGDKRIFDRSESNE
jgi:hypothetical protein